MKLLSIYLERLLTGGMRYGMEIKEVIVLVVGGRIRGEREILRIRLFVRYENYFFKLVIELRVRIFFRYC